MQQDQFKSFGGNKDTYQRPLSRQYRGLFVLLLDQSSSMQQRAELSGHPLTLAQLAASVINNIFLSIINSAPFDPQTGRRKDYCDIALFGYGDRVVPLLHPIPVSVSELATRPVGRVRVRVTKYNQLEGKYVVVDEEQPFWIEPHAGSSRTEMAGAIQYAQKVVEDWLMADSNRRRSFPPIVLNIMDGMHNGLGDPVQEADRLKQLSTDDGHVLLFNCHITKNENAQTISFPDRLDPLKNRSRGEFLGVEQLFQMSSLVPLPLLKQAEQAFGTKLLPGARALVYNANGRDLVNFLSWGTRTSTGHETIYEL